MSYQEFLTSEQVGEHTEWVAGRVVAESGLALAGTAAPAPDDFAGMEINLVR